MTKLYPVRCGNPYFCGEMHGVQFEQSKGGAVGMATREQAEQIVKESNFSCLELEADLADEEAQQREEPTLGLIDVKGIGPKTAEKLVSQSKVSTLEELAGADAEVVAAVLGEKVEVVQDWQAQARELTKPE